MPSVRSKGGVGEGGRGTAVFKFDYLCLAFILNFFLLVTRTLIWVFQAIGIKNNDIRILFWKASKHIPFEAF